MVLESVHDQDLARAARRAYVHSLTAKMVEAKQFGHNGSEFYDVASFSTPGSFHRVRLDFSADGVSAHCDCLAGQNEKICQHIAAALEASNSIPAVEPEPAPRPRSEALELMDRAGLLGPNFPRRSA